MEPGMSTARDTGVHQLRNAAHDAFMAFWRGADTADADGLWLRYCADQERYEQCLRVEAREPVVYPLVVDVGNFFPGTTSVI
jgi:hypothetical protein